jgi:cytochrome b6-f complex iron-sulfur subunit
MNRRDLLKNIAAGTATLFVVPAVVTSCDDETPDPNQNGDPNTLTIDLNDGKYSNLAQAGGSVIEGSIIIFNTGSGFLALSSVCTHNGCTIAYDHGSGNLPCPCHGSIFSTTGSVLNGPAESSLRKYEVEQEGDILTIAL